MRSASSRRGFIGLVGGGVVVAAGTRGVVVPTALPDPVVTLRREQGHPLTVDQMDENFSELRRALVRLHRILEKGRMDVLSDVEESR